MEQKNKIKNRTGAKLKTMIFGSSRFIKAHTKGEKNIKYKVMRKSFRSRRRKKKFLRIQAIISIYTIKL